MNLRQRLHQALTDADHAPGRYSPPQTLSDGLRIELSLTHGETRLRLTHPKHVPTAADLQKILAALPYPKPTHTKPTTRVQAGRWTLLTSWPTPARLIPDAAPAEQEA